MPRGLVLRPLLTPRRRNLWNFPSRAAHLLRELCAVTWIPCLTPAAFVRSAQGSRSMFHPKGLIGIYSLLQFPIETSLSTLQGVSCFCESPAELDTLSTPTKNSGKRGDVVLVFWCLGPGPCAILKLLVCCAQCQNGGGSNVSQINWGLLTRFLFKLCLSVNVCVRCERFDCWTKPTSASRKLASRGGGCFSAKQTV